MKKLPLLKSIIITLIVAGIYYYVSYPALNITNWEFWIYIIFLSFIFLAVYSILSARITIAELFNKKPVRSAKVYKVFLFIPISVLAILLINFFCTPFFNSEAYYKRIEVENGIFEEEIKEVDFNKLPLLDRDSTLKIGDRTMGQMSELVSQFDVSEEYTQINYNDEILRVTPLEYNGFIKWITNRKNGIKAYITVNSTTGKAKLVKMEKGMKYAPSAYFNENLYRKIQMSYPTKNIEKVNFEIDNDGNPYWIASVVKYVGVGLRRDVVGVIIFNPINGKSNYYDVNKVPNWVDHVYEADLILEQVADWGAYKNGFWNTIFGQKEVVETTTGYNYLAQDDDIYLYTGITSVIADESNIGFILTNLRTKETKYYSVAGAEEYSAMDSAEGQVQQMKYKSTFPLLINLNGKPTYLVSLKDNAGLVKMYAFVDVVDYQKVVATDSSQGIEKAAEAYLNETLEEETEIGKHEKEITIFELKTAIIDGNTMYYFRDQNEQKYKISIKENKNLLPFLQNGDKVIIKYNKETEVITITDIKY